MTRRLQKHCLGYVPLESSEVEDIYDGRNVFDSEPVQIDKLCRSHERLRHELLGAITLLDEDARKIASLEAEIIELRQILASNH